MAKNISVSKFANLSRVGNSRRYSANQGRKGQEKDHIPVEKLSLLENRYTFFLQLAGRTAEAQEKTPTAQGEDIIFSAGTA
jgi:hypothetical protein